MPQKKLVLLMWIAWAAAWPSLVVEGMLLAVSLENRDTGRAWYLLGFTVVCAGVVALAFTFTGMWVERKRMMTGRRLVVILPLAWVVALVCWTIVTRTTAGQGDAAQATAVNAILVLLVAQPTAIILAVVGIIRFRRARSGSVAV